MTKHSKIGGLSVKCIKKGGFQGQNGQIFFNICQIKESNLLLKIVNRLTIKCENEGSLSDKDVSGSFGDKEFVKHRGHWVNVSKNGGLSVKARGKK